jgi:hypothetical protein
VFTSAEWLSTESLITIVFSLRALDATGLREHAFLEIRRAHCHRRALE